MSLKRIAAISFLGIALGPSTEAGQQPAQALRDPATRVIERTYPSGGVLPSRVVRSASKSGDREIVTETEEMPGADGRMEPVREVVTEIIRAGRVVRMRADAFGIGSTRQRRLLETTESVDDSSTEGRLEAVDTTSRSDLNGRLTVTSNVTEETTGIGSDTRRTETTLHRPDLDGRLRPDERTEHSERQVSPQALQQVTTQLRADINGRWQVTEIRNRDVQKVGGWEERTEETIQRRNSSGALAERERSVIRVTNQPGREDVSIETFTHEGSLYLFRSSIRPSLTQRIRRTTNFSADGGREVIEEIEARSLVAPDDPLRIIRRTVETVRPVGPDRWERERQVFERDPNNRLVLTLTETED